MGSSQLKEGGSGLRIHPYAHPATGGSVQATSHRSAEPGNREGAGPPTQASALAAPRRAGPVTEGREHASTASLLLDQELRKNGDASQRYKGIVISASPPMHAQAPGPAARGPHDSGASLDGSSTHAAGRKPDCAEGDAVLTLGPSAGGTGNQAIDSFLSRAQLDVFSTETIAGASGRQAERVDSALEAYLLDSSSGSGSSSDAMSGHGQSRRGPGTLGHHSRARPPASVPRACTAEHLCSAAETHSSPKSAPSGNRLFLMGLPGGRLWGHSPALCKTVLGTRQLRHCLSCASTGRCVHQSPAAELHEEACTISCNVSSSDSCHRPCKLHCNAMLVFAAYGLRDAQDV